jgi:hypothetical protein
MIDPLPQIRYKPAIPTDALKRTDPTGYPASTYTDAELVQLPRSTALRYLLGQMRHADNSPMLATERKAEAGRVLRLVAQVLSAGKKHETVVAEILEAYDGAST